MDIPKDFFQKSLGKVERIDIYSQKNKSGDEILIFECFPTTKPGNGEDKPISVLKVTRFQQKNDVGPFALYDILEPFQKMVVNIHTFGFDQLDSKKIKCESVIIKYHLVNGSMTIGNIKAVINKFRQLVKDELNHWEIDQNITELYDKLDAIDDLVILYDWVVSFMLERDAKFETDNLSLIEIKSLLMSEIKYLGKENFEKLEYHAEMNLATERNEMLKWHEVLRMQRKNETETD